MDLPSKTVVVVTLDVEPEWEAELNRWYEEEHIPALLSLPGFLGADRYLALDGAPKYMAFYQLAGLDAWERAAGGELRFAPEHAARLDTARTRRLRPHFQARSAIYEQLTSADGLIEGVAWDGGRASVGAVNLMRSAVASSDEPEFNRWYAEEHLPQLAAVPGVILARRFRAVQGGPRYMARYDLLGPEVLQTEAWEHAAETPWTHRVRKTYTERWLTVYAPIPRE
jgi:hypothetical protein